jgi:hypothetical protein
LGLVVGVLRARVNGAASECVYAPVQRAEQRKPIRALLVADSFDPFADQSEIPRRILDTSQGALSIWGAKMF